MRVVGVVRDMANNGSGRGRRPEKWVVVALSGSPLSCPVAPDARVLRLESPAGHRPHSRLVLDEPVPSPEGDEKCFVDAYLAWREANDASPMPRARVVMSMDKELFYSFLSRAKLALERAQSPNERNPRVEDTDLPSMPQVWARLGNLLFENVSQTQSGSGLLSVNDLNARLCAKPQDVRMTPKTRMAAELGDSLEGLSGLDRIRQSVRSHFDGCEFSQETNTEALELNFQHRRTSKRVWVKVKRSSDPSGSEQSSCSSLFMIMDCDFVVDQVVLGRDYDFRVGIYRAAFANHDIRTDTLSLIERIEQVGVNWDEANLNVSLLDDLDFKFLIARRKQTRALTVKRDNRSFRLYIEEIKQVDHQGSNGLPKVTVRQELEVICLELSERASTIEPPVDVACRMSEQDVSSPPSEVEQDANTLIELVAHLYQFVHEIATHVLPKRL